MTEEKKRKLETETEIVKPHIFVFAEEEADALHFVGLFDPEGQKIADILDKIEKEIWKEEGRENAELLCNFWNKVRDPVESTFSEKEMEAMIKTFGDKFWEKNWKFYDNQQLPCEDFPNVHVSTDWC